MEKKSKSGRVVRTILCVILVLALFTAGTIWGLFRREIATLNSLKCEAANYYTIDYKADYGLDEFLKEGASTDGELAAFIIRKLLKGLPVTISLPDLGCSAFNAVTPDGDKIFGRNFDNMDAEYLPLFHAKHSQTNFSTRSLDERRRQCLRMLPTAMGLGDLKVLAAVAHCNYSIGSVNPQGQAASAVLYQ